MDQDISSKEFRTKRDFHEIRDRSSQVRELFTRQKVVFHPTSAIGGLLKDAEALVDNYIAGKAGESEFQILLRAAHLDRMVDALLLLERELNCRAYLKKLTSASLNFLERTHSPAKDTFWEIELWGILKRNDPNVRLVDPPDIIMDTTVGPLAIACKKIYSKKNAVHQLSSAVKQLKPFGGIGIAAINIDDLVPGDSLLRSRTAAEMLQFIDAGNIRFLASCEQPIRKYFESGRLSAVAICTSLLAEVTHDGTRFNNAKQMTIWVWPGVPAVVLTQIEAFAKAMGVPFGYK